MSTTSKKGGCTISNVSKYFFPAICKRVIVAAFVILNNCQETTNYWSENSAYDVRNIFFTSASKLHSIHQKASELVHVGQLLDNSIFHLQMQLQISMRCYYHMFINYEKNVLLLPLNLIIL